MWYSYLQYDVLLCLSSLQPDPNCKLILFPVNLRRLCSLILLYQIRDDFPADSMCILILLFLF